MDSTPPSLGAALLGSHDAPQLARNVTLKQDDSFAVYGPAGNFGGGAQGLYFRDTRHLSFLGLRLNGAAPLLLGEAPLDDNSALLCDLTNPALPDEGAGAPLPRGTIHLRRTLFLWGGAQHERLVIRNYDTLARRLHLEFHFAADFVDLFEIRGQSRARRGEMHRPTISADRVCLAYTGLDGIRRETRLQFTPEPRLLEAQRVVYNIEVPPGGRRSVFLSCRFDASASRLRFGEALYQARAVRGATLAHAARVRTDDTEVNETLRRAGADLAMLVTNTPQGPYPYAGTPWYSTPFGRDALITAWQTLWIAPGLARGVLRFLAANQATEVNAANDAEPGKILHEMRNGEMSLLGEVPFRRYYGSVDATPLFVMLAGAYLDRTNDLATIHELWPNIEAALGWIDGHGDADGDGFTEYYRKTPDGILNQGWKDSHDSIFHADGSMAEGPIALVEMQGYVYAAWLAAARIARRIGDEARASRLEARAETLRAAFDAAFWDDALGTYVLALDGAKRPCRVRSSNAGHALFTGIALPHRAERLAATLLSPASFCGWGIRTLAVGEARYNPMSYHNGSVWPHDNALIAEGFARYGLGDAAARVFEAIFATARHDPSRRLPELFCGVPRQPGHGPTLYPVACSPQAWAASTPFALLRACIGLQFRTGSNEVVLEKPALPKSLESVTLRNLSLGEERIDLVLRRERGALKLETPWRSGNITARLT